MTYNWETIQKIKDYFSDGIEPDFDMDISFRLSKAILLYNYKNSEMDEEVKNQLDSALSDTVNSGITKENIEAFIVSVMEELDGSSIESDSILFWKAKNKKYSDSEKSMKEAYETLKQELEELKSEFDKESTENMEYQIKFFKNNVEQQKETIQLLTDKVAELTKELAKYKG